MELCRAAKDKKMKKVVLLALCVGPAFSSRNALSQEPEELPAAWNIDGAEDVIDDGWIQELIDKDAAQTPDQRRQRDPARAGEVREARSRIGREELRRLERLPPTYADSQVKARRIGARYHQEMARDSYGDPDNRVYVEYNGVLQPLQGWALVEQYGRDGRALRGPDGGALRVPHRVDAVLRNLEREGMQRGSSGARIAPMSPSHVEIRSDARVTSGLNVPSLRPAFLLPAPRGRNDLFYNPLNPRSTRLGGAAAPLNRNGLRAAKDADDLFWTRLNIEPSFAAAFDTGFIGGDGFSVPDIALGHSPQAGQTTIASASNLVDVPVNVLFDTQATNVRLPVFGDQQLQLYADANNFSGPDTLRTENVFIRGWNKEATSLAAGKTYSLFSAANFVPSSLLQGTTLIGSSRLDQNTRQQLRLQQTPAAAGGWGWGVAVEDPFEQDTFIPAGGTRLGRWPSFSGNVVLAGANPVNRVQFSVLFRSLGFEANTGQEFFDTGWGLSAYVRQLVFYDQCTQSALFLGVAGGEGIGQYTHGIGISAAFDGSSFASLGALGAYAGYSQRWFNFRGWETGANLAYGYATLDTQPFLPADTNRALHQCFANLLVYPSQHLAMGFEYQYGRRETIAMGAGENNRFLFVVRLTKEPEVRTNQRYQDAQGRSVNMAGRSDVPELRRGVAGYANLQTL